MMSRRETELTERIDGRLAHLRPVRGEIEEFPLGTAPHVEPNDAWLAILGRLDENDQRPVGYPLHVEDAGFGGGADRLGKIDRHGGRGIDSEEDETA